MLASIIIGDMHPNRLMHSTFGGFAAFAMMAFTSSMPPLRAATSTPADSPRPAATPTLNLHFKSDGAGGFTFDTGMIRGHLHSKGKSLGLTEVIHVPTQSRMDRSNGLLSHYRVFTVGRRYGGGAWDWPSTASLLDDGSVRVDWPAAEDRPFAMHAVYRLAAPDTVEVETTVEPKAELSGFEVFLASYFDAAFTNASVWCRSGSAPEFIQATPDRGEWQMYTRDRAAHQLANDGRWKLEPHPVDWKFPSELAGPHALAERRADHLNLVAGLKSSLKECFAVATPHQFEGHYSTYLSLFGHTLSPGTHPAARAELKFRPARP